MRGGRIAATTSDQLGKGSRVGAPDTNRAIVSVLAAEGAVQVRSSLEKRMRF